MDTIFKRLANLLGGYADKGQELAENTLGEEQTKTLDDAAMNMAMGTLGPSASEEQGTKHIFDKLIESKTEGQGIGDYNHLVGEKVTYMGRPTRITSYDGKNFKMSDGTSSGTMSSPKEQFFKYASPGH